MAEPIQFELEIDADGAIKGLKRVQGELGDTVDGMHDADEGAEGLGGSFGKMGKSAGVAAAAVAGATVAFTAAFVAAQKLGQEFERQISIINRFSGDISEASDRLNGAISNLDLMVVQTRLANAGLELTSEQFANLAVAANEMAASTGDDSVAALEQLGQAIITGGEELLKYGVNLNGVTDRAGKQAAALEQLGDRYAGVESSADSLGGKIGELEVLLENYTTAIIADLGASQALEDALDDLASAFGFTGGFVEDTLVSVEDFAMGVTIVVTNIVERLASLTRAITQLATGDLANASLELDRFVNNTLEDTALLVGAETGVRRAQEQRRREARESELASGGGIGRSGGRSAGPSGPDPQERELEILGQLKDKREAEAEAEVERQAMIREARFATINEIEERERESADAIVEIRKRQREQERQLREAGLAAEERVAKREQELTEQTEAANLQVAKDTTSAAIQGGDMLLEAFGATQGQMELWRGISDAAQAITSFASQNYLAGGLYVLSSALHFKNAAEMGVGGGSAAASTAGAAGAQAGSARPVEDGSGGGEGGVTNNVINFNIPVPESEVGRMQRRADRAASRRFG